jgi:hypothetical protein
MLNTLKENVMIASETLPIFYEKSKRQKNENFPGPIAKLNFTQIFGSKDGCFIIFW